MRPGMYIGKLGDGSSPDDGIYILLKEVLDNSIDEFVMGAGKTIEIPSREVKITDFELTGVKMPDIHFSVSCSKGTYIRSLAHDFGQKLGCGAHLTSLKRTSIGSYPLSAALTLHAFLHSLEAKS